ncbi:alpha/beta-hydrolase [Sphaerulina musiva SO2202]|uniref:Alpha/beta-hydrolase n=1 Tax=Sphaerulina musiva (strain SO2202) TaxID=692275 RepID=M3B703_SPHMS|nr:alpha/beta-hydrolase [Sphaerulina musiva SO2202]EMF15607.1 alpha/beta-hydrolase [Sphaerulina musiva SO2202]
MLLSNQELVESARTHPEVAAFYAKHPQPPPRKDLLVARAELRALNDANLRRIGPPPSGIEEFYHDIEMRDGFNSTLKICKPTNTAPGPLVVLLFGGGFIAGDKDQLTETARICAQLYSATVVNLSYRLGPEHKFPYAQNDALDSLEWIAKNATTPLLAADPTIGFLIGGVSAGAAISAALSRKFQERSLAYPLTGQWLAVPSLMHEGCCPPKYKTCYISLTQNSSCPRLGQETRDRIMEAVRWDKDSDLRYAANSKTPMAGQPRTYLQVDGQDPLRDDALIYDEMLREAGVKTKLDLYPGCPHAHWSSMRGLEIGNKALIDTVVGLGWLLNRKVPREVAAAALKVSVAS